jgi:hypothetical protein
MKIALLFLLSIKTLAFNIPGMNMGIDIDHNPVWRNYRNSIRLEVSKCNIEVNEKKLSLNSRDNYQSVFDIISSFDSDFITKTKELLEDGEVQIKDFSQGIRNKYGIDEKTSALYIHEEKSIYINKKDEAGLLAIFLYHELSHAFDDKIPSEMEVIFDLYDRYNDFYSEMVAKAKTRGYVEGAFLGNYLTTEEDLKLEALYNAYNSKDLIARFRAERYAFDRQDIFVNFLVNTYQCYDSYLEEHKDLNKLKLYKDTPDSYIRSAYGL